MNRRSLLLAGAATLAITKAASAEGSIMVMNAMVRPPVVASIGVGALYVMLMNHGSEDDRLLAISTSEAARVEMHETVEKDGVVSMQPVGSLAIPAGGMLELKTGGLHGMILGLKRELKQGESVPFTLTFEKAGEVAVTAKVEAVGEMHDHNHGAEAPAVSN